MSAPYFLATKIAAFHGRGGEDIAVGHDLEDVIFVIDGRAAIVDEVRSEAAPLRAYLEAEFGALLGTAGFIDALPGYLLPDAASQARITIILGRMRALTA